MNIPTLYSYRPHIFRVNLVGIPSIDHPGPLGSIGFTGGFTLFLPAGIMVG